MIPYDDLVAALAAWRARQGLPVVQVAGAAVRPAPAPAPVRPVAPAAPASAPPRVAAQPGPDPDYADSDLEETPYYSAGDDYVVALGGEPGESTSIGGAPEPVAEGLLVPKHGKRNPTW